MYICDECETVFENELVHEYEPCPIKDCWGKIIDIDENLLEAYKLLNYKGYITVNCCSGHSSECCPRTYIQFYDVIKFTHLPKDFVAETRRINNDSEYVTNISKSYNKRLFGVELQKQIWNTCLDILEWAESLDEVDKIVE